MGVITAILRQTAIAGGADGNFTGGVIANIAIDVGIDHILPGSVQLRKRSLELPPILGRIDQKKRIARPFIQRPAQRHLPGFTRKQGSENGPVARDNHIHEFIGPVLDMDGLTAVDCIFPSVRSQELSLSVDAFEVNVFHSRANIGKSPGDALVMSHNHVRHAGKRHAGNIQWTAFQVGFIP